MQALVTGELHHATLWREIAPQDRQTTGHLQRTLDGHDHVLALFFDRRPGDLLDGSPVHGLRRPVDVAATKELARHERRPSRGVKVGSNITTAGFEVGDYRRLLGDAIELLER
jgi:hypothetical protein